jgi:hypothetical protein
LDLLGVEFERVLGELESLLNERLELPNAAALVAEDLLSVRGADDDLGAGVGDADLAAGVALLGELAGAVPSDQSDTSGGVVTRTAGTGRDGIGRQCKVGRERRSAPILVTHSASSVPAQQALPVLLLATPPPSSSQTTPSPHHTSFSSGVAFKPDR